ncbi:hypothetical protein NUW58_g4499 [Xylaria curta]|uniref:Uncharacterized protein n=1 Tax=Xylaria curta TaxID=42375 RepID=A0ACC1P8N0_9PEZI|nr:hypothetical protein NUW58_g4499 [Xylaria curta]
MFLHSGASLHGHEFSKRATQAVANPSNLRNPLLRSTLSPPANRASTVPPRLPRSCDDDAIPDLKKSKTYPEPATQAVDNGLINSQEPGGDLPVSQLETMSEDGTSIISDTDASKASSLARRKRQSTYVLAHPPPRLRTKQRIIHVRPNLVLQIQQVTAGLRPRPTIDVYPSFAGAGSIMAPLLGRVSRIAGIKRELSGQDILLVRSEDYAPRASGSESDNDGDGIMARDLLAVLSPSKTEDKAEIVMAEGMVWVATTRSSGTSFSYEFTSVDVTGTTVTARWVRKQTMPSSLPGTPTSPNSNSTKPQLSDTKFSFSFVDPNCRRHPILATLTSGSLTIPETYTTVPQSVNRYSSVSQNLSPPNSPGSDDQTQTERRVQVLEEWQKSFISISAVWVVLRHGWAPDFRPEDFLSLRASATFQPDGCLHGRRRSLSASTDSSPSSKFSEATGRRKYPIGIRQNDLRSANDVPRRATSTGAAFVQKRRAVLREEDDQFTDGERDRTSKLNRRALSGDWNIGLPKGAREKSLAESLVDAASVTPRSNPEDHQPPALAPSSRPNKRRAVSAYSPLGDMGILELNDASNVAHSLEPGDVSDPNTKGRYRKFKNMANWFRKLSGR